MRRFIGLGLLAGVFAPVWGCGLLVQLFGGLSGPSGLGPIGGAGTVQVHLDNQSGYRVNVLAEYWFDDTQVRKTELVLDFQGVESQDDILPTTTKLLKIVATVAEVPPTSMPITRPTTQPTSAPITDSNPAEVGPGDTLLDVELHWMHDFADGSTLTVVIPPPKPPAADFLDCNHNSVADVIDIASGTSRDCNCNKIPDECDLADGTLHDDAPADGVPDECAKDCPPLDVVVIMDTSGSMVDEAAALCAEIDAVSQSLRRLGLAVRSTLLGINSRPLQGFECLTDDVVNLLGDAVPGGAECCASILSDEDWGPATAVVAARFAWTEGAVRVIISISDEAPRIGDPCNNPGDDADATDLAIRIAKANQVSVFPITAGGALPCTVDLATRLARETGGMTFASSDPQADLARAIQTSILAACSMSHGCGSK